MADIVHVRADADEVDIDRRGELAGELVVALAGGDVEAGDAAEDGRHLKPDEGALRFFVGEVEADGGLFVFLLAGGVKVGVEHEVGSGGEFAGEAKRQNSRCATDGPAAQATKAAGENVVAAATA